VDLVNIEAFAKRVISLAEYRKNLHEYLANKMTAVSGFFFFSLTSSVFCVVLDTSLIPRLDTTRKKPSLAPRVYDDYDHLSQT